jgi:galactokinase
MSNLIAKFVETFGGGGAPLPLRAPGRVNLIGEHTDYNAGFVFPMAIEPEVRMVVRTRGDSVVRAASTFKPGEVLELAIDRELVPHADPGHWSNYLAGPLHHLRLAGHTLVGMDVLIDSTLPAGSGLSSSAAMEVATVRAQLLLTGHEMPVSQIAAICQKAEHTFPKAPVGIMDMTASAGGKAGHAMLLDCRSLEIRYVPLPAEELRVVILNTKVSHSLAGGGEYKKRRDSCELAAKTMGVSHLRDANLGQLAAAEKSLDGVTYRRARHVITEIQRCLDAAEALVAGDYEKMGRLMMASHASLRDDYEVSCEELDFMSEQAMTVKGVYGARMTGGGFGGSAVALCRPGAVEPLREHIAGVYKAKFGIDADIIATAATDGAGPM